MFRSFWTVLLTGFFIWAVSLSGTASAHFGFDDGDHPGGFGIQILAGAIAIVILMLYIAYMERRSEEDAESIEGKD